MKKLDQQQIIDQIMIVYSTCGSIIDAIIDVCNTNDVEIEAISNYIKYSKELKEIVRSEATSLKLLK